MRTLQAIHDALSDAGFEVIYTGSRNRYYGDLQCAGRRVPVWVEIPDPDLIRHPNIALVERPAEIPAICAHIQANNHICYSTPGRDVLDPYRAGEYITSCLQSATRVVDAALAGDCLADTQDEFEAYWDGESPLLVDVEPNAPDGWVKVFEVFAADALRYYLASNDPEAFRRAGYTVKEYTGNFYLTSTRNAPIAAQGDWPPRTLNHLVSWLKSIDGGYLYKKLRDAIQEHAAKSRAMGFIVRSPGAWWGGIFTADELLWKSSANNGRRWVKQVLACGLKWPITRLSVNRADPAYLVGRNLGGRASLLGKRILLVGCGTIGGYLADQLVRAGAGVGGSRSELVLCDYDLLLPGNIGRHYLGVNYLYCRKADSMVKQLALAIPHARVRGVTCDARKLTLDNYDLVIDATGSEALSWALNDRLQSLPRFVPSIFVWNEGGGAASQCLLVDTPKAACYRCLTDRNGHARFSPLKNPGADPFVSGPCDSAYVPYPAMVSMQAAALAARVILDWVDGRPGKRLRTLTHDHEQGKIVRDTTPERTSQCPACSHVNGVSRTADSFS